MAATTTSKSAGLPGPAASKQPDLPAIPAALQDHQQAISNLDENLNRLAQRLTPVMLPAPVGLIEEPSTDGLSSLAATIQQQTLYLCRLNATVEGLLRDLQLP